MASGVYEIRNRVSGKRYIGSSKNIGLRWTCHRKRLRRGNHHSRYLQFAWNKYGEGSFTFQILLRCPVEDCVVEEQRFFDALRPEYNMDPIAGSPLGRVMSAETKAKMCRARRGHIVSQKTRDKLRSARTGKRHSYETRAKISASKRSQRRTFLMTQETRCKISASLKGHGFSPETLAKMRAAKLGKPSPKRGIKVSVDTVKRMRQSRLGKSIAGVQVVDTATGVRYASIKQAARAVGLKASTLAARLRGQSRNNSTLELACTV